MFKSFLNNVIHFDFQKKKRQEAQELSFEERVKSWVDFVKQHNNGEPRAFIVVALGDDHDQLFINHKFQSSTQMLGCIELLKYHLSKINIDK